MKYAYYDVGAQGSVCNIKIQKSHTSLTRRQVLNGLMPVAPPQVRRILFEFIYYGAAQKPCEESS